MFSSEVHEILSYVTTINQSSRYHLYGKRVSSLMGIMGIVFSLWSLYIRSLLSKQRIWTVTKKQVVCPLCTLKNNFYSLRVLEYLVFRIQFLFKPKPGEQLKDHKFYRTLYPQIIDDIDVSVYYCNEKVIPIICTSVPSFRCSTWH